MCYRDKAAWQEEFWPTTAAEYVLHLLWTLSKRALWLSDPESRQSYVAAVPKASKFATSGNQLQCAAASTMAFVASTVYLCGMQKWLGLMTGKLAAAALEAMPVHATEDLHIQSDKLMLQPVDWMLKVTGHFGFSYNTGLVWLQNMLRSFRNKLGRLAKMAEDLRNMASPEWIPKVSAYINTCHYLEHHLRQSHLPRLLMHDDSASLAPTPDCTRDTTPVPPSPDPRTSAFTPNNFHLASPADSLIAMPTERPLRPNGGAAVDQVGAYEVEAGANGSFWKKWSLKLARAIVLQFEMDSRSYRYKSHLSEFSNTSYDREEG